MGEDVRPILERARQGDREAFGWLVERYHRRVYATARRIMGGHDEAHDVVQEAFVRALRGMASFDGRCEFFTWLYRITINVALNHMRQQKRRRSVPLEEGVLPRALQATTRDPARLLELKQLSVDIQEAIAELSDTLRVTLVMVVVEGHSYREAAEILECSEGTVAWRVHEARKKLSIQLKQYLGTSSGDADKDDDGLRGDTSEAVDSRR